MKIVRDILSGVSAGIMISIGGAVYLSASSESKILAAVLFSVALLSICYRGYALYTGKVGFIVESHGKDDFSTLFLCLLGNTIATIVCGYAIRYAIAATGDAARALADAKLTQTLPSTFIRAAFCGVLMYIAVSVFRENKSTIGILFAIPVFILAGFEHSIADMFYFAASGIVSARACVYLWVVILGNSVGAMILPALNYKGKPRDDKV